MASRGLGWAHGQVVVGPGLGLGQLVVGGGAGRVPSVRGRAEGVWWWKVVVVGEEYRRWRGSLKEIEMVVVGVILRER